MNETKERARANAVITVHKYKPAAYDEPTHGPALTRIHVEESFCGDISGDGVVEFVQAARADGSASFAGIKRVTGTAAGRQGTFPLHDAGTGAPAISARRYCRDGCADTPADRRAGHPAGPGKVWISPDAPASGA